MGFCHSGTANYLYQHPSGYFFRYRIPQDLKAVVGKTEFRYSLRTGIFRIARYRARLIAGYIQGLFNKVRTDMEKFSPEKITRLVQDYIRETLANDEMCRAKSLPTLEGKTILESSSMKSDEARSLLTSVDRWLKSQDHSLMHLVTERIIKEQGEAVDPESEAYKVLSRELLKAFKGILNVRIKRSEGDYSESDEDLMPILKQQRYSHREEQRRSKAHKFSEVQEHYLNEVEKREGWTEKTKAENLSIFALFVRVVGDLPVDEIDRQLMSEFKETLMKLPPNLNKLSKFKDKSIAQILAMKHDQTISVNTINKYLRRLSGLFNYAVQHGYMANNPAEGMQIRQQKRPDEEREAYTKEDLHKLFHSEEYRNGTHRQSYGFWTPLIALYSGCRLEEICQLHLDDIRQEQGVWVFDINDKKEKRLKTLSSRRLVPIHPKLIELGLLEYVEKLKAKGETRLFPELSQRRDGYGQTVSKWFARYKKRCGIEEGKNFHSFRHTFITHLKHKQVDPFMIHELDGHAIDSQTMGRYGKRYTPDILLREAVGKIDYGVDLSFLKVD
jgi:integrase